MIDLESLFNLSYGMYIVSSESADKLSGCIINTVFQIMPEPPTMALSINKQSLTHQYITQSNVFTVSILSQGAPMSFIGRFGFRSSRDIDKFQKTKYKISQTGSPIVLDYTIGFVEAEVINSIELPTHCQKRCFLR